MSYKIVQVLEKDLDFVLSLNQNALSAVSHSTYDKMNHFLKISSYFKILKMKKIPVGFLIGLSPKKNYASENYKWFNKRYDSFLYIDRIVIHENYQRMGLGTILYEDLKSTALDKVPLIACEVNIKPYNTQSINFHKKYGFIEVGQQDTEGGRRRVSLMTYQLP